MEVKWRNLFGDVRSPGSRMPALAGFGARGFHCGRRARADENRSPNGKEPAMHAILAIILFSSPLLLPDLLSLMFIRKECQGKHVRRFPVTVINCKPGRRDGNAMGIETSEDNMP
jgi:hypothetical protein